MTKPDVAVVPPAHNIVLVGGSIFVPACFLIDVRTPIDVGVPAAVMITAMMAASVMAAAVVTLPAAVTFRIR